MWAIKKRFLNLPPQRKVNRMEVCCAIIIRESQILAVQRGPLSSHPWKWEFPGGKTDLHETAEQCIIREIEEELSIKVEVITELASIEFDYGNHPFRLVPLVCKIIGGEIHLTEHVALRWLTPDKLETLDWSAADEALIIKNLEVFKLFADEHFDQANGPTAEIRWQRP